MLTFFVKLKIHLNFVHPFLKFCQEKNLRRPVMSSCPWPCRLTTLLLGQKGSCSCPLLSASWCKYSAILSLRFLLIQTWISLLSLAVLPDRLLEDCWILRNVTGRVLRDFKFVMEISSTTTTYCLLLRFCPISKSGSYTNKRVRC